ncbi:hypothetical protein QQS21_004736 [Conoideocrella luteorostrata]|uniref:SnoaL-like domain-containing protein n=1 Tax=Conoideocrella luteorostrata TaxID=1105319 RepID=A0AAJ0CV08_9HYPO|nr:hypothetical protein QQS21_004736 [Conoideocrella luteorostrata]
MSGQLSGGYFPIYPHHDDLPDPEIRTFITNFYRDSDRADRNELWISHFTQDAQVVMGNDRGTGEQEIRELRSRMWTTVQERQHSVFKVFPGRFGDQNSDSGDLNQECEFMLFGEVKLQTKLGQSLAVPWAGHAILKKGMYGEKEEWKFRHYQVWLQK